MFESSNEVFVGLIVVWVRNCKIIFNLYPANVENMVSS